MSQQLEQLFKRCDTKGSGYIDQHEFRELCRGFSIDDGDADIIFDDLDHDGDGRISFEDFSFGFRDFLTPGARRGSIQLGFTSPTSPVQKTFNNSNSSFEDQDQMMRKQRDMERKQAEAREAWKSFADHLGKEDVKKILSFSSDKIFSLYEELQSSDAPPHLIDHYEEVISALMTDVKKMEDETKKLEEKMAKERETHTAHLKSIEAELDAQVARVEVAAREKARRDYEAEKKELQEKMEMEMMQLQSQLKIFQKIDSYLCKEKDETLSKESQKRLENAIRENRELKNSLNQTQTNIALLRSEMNQIRSQYDAKCYELNEERENKLEFVYEFDNLNRQLDLLREANQRLQDTNDGLRSVVDVGAISSPRVSSRHEFANLVSPDILRSSSDKELAEKLARPFSRRSRLRASGNSSQTLSDNDSDSIRSRTSERVRPKISEAHFGSSRSLPNEAEDSGHSTSHTDFGAGIHADQDSKLGQEIDEAINALDEAVEDPLEKSEAPNPAPRSSKGQRYPDQDRDISEVSHEKSKTDKTSSAASGVEIEVTDHCFKPEKETSSKDKSKEMNFRPSSGKVKRPLTDLEPTGPPDRTYKVVFAGDASVGKTSFINRITKGVFLTNLSSTLGVDFQVKTIRVDERNIAIQLWDTAGQERFRSVTRSYFRRADGVMLLYDVTSDRSFLSVRNWIEAVDDVSEKRIPIMLCANKVDLRGPATAKGRRCISLDEGQWMAREHSAIFIETSAKEGKNVIEALVQLTRDMCSSEDVEVQTSALKIRDDEGKRKSCCKK